MMETILHLEDKCREIISKSLPMSVISKSRITDKVVNMKYNISNDELEKFEDINKEIDTICENILKENGVMQ